MPTHNEVQRLTKVYANYHESSATRARWSETNPGNQAMVAERTHVLGQILEESKLLPLTDRYILDIGCGSGKVLASFTQWGALPDHLYGIDLLTDRVIAAKRRFPTINFQHANAEQLNFRDSSFDLVLLYTVFTSILDDGMAHNVAREVRRVLKPGGAVLWYDFRYNNPRNPNVRGMPKAAIRALFPDFELRLRSVTLLPPLARRLGRMMPVLYPLLVKLPLLRTHYLGLLVKPSLGSSKERI